MTKQHFDAIASVLNARLNEWHGHQGESYALEVIIDDLLPILAASNPRFNEAKFMEAVYNRNGE